MSARLPLALALLCLAPPVHLACSDAPPPDDGPDVADTSDTTGDADISVIDVGRDSEADGSRDAAPDAIADAGDADSEDAPVEGGVCTPCRRDAECDGLCVELIDGFFCAPPCPALGCPDGTICDTVDLVGGRRDLCVPRERACEPCASGVQRNACGGCEPLPGEPGAQCGICAGGTWVCDGRNALICRGDRGDLGLNACGGCAFLPGTPEEVCGACSDGVWTCESPEILACAGATPDSDGDGVCDPDDLCSEGDDRLDNDLDGVPDACDPCPLDRNDDSDGDGVCDSDDRCAGFDDSADADGDGRPDACDRCSAGDDADDADGDGRPDACDCDAVSCAIGAVCTESVDGAQCACPGGTELDDGGDAPACVDVDECARELDDCHPIAACGNTDGGFTCTCPDGYSGSGTRCDDIDECALDEDDCAAGALCVNAPGSFSCRCPLGFEGDGRTCTRITAHTFGFPTGSDTRTSQAGGELLTQPGHGYRGSRTLPIASISRVTGVSIVLDQNNLYSTGDLGCFGFASMSLSINGTVFGSAFFSEGGEPGFFAMDPPPAPVSGPDFDVRLTVTTMACGSIDVSELASTITVAP